MALSEIYSVKGYRKEHFFDEDYKDFEKEISKEDLIEMLKSSKFIVSEVKRKTINNE